MQSTALPGSHVSVELYSSVASGKTAENITVAGTAVRPVIRIAKGPIIHRMDAEECRLTNLPLPVREPTAMSTPPQSWKALFSTTRCFSNKMPRETPKNLITAFNPVSLKDVGFAAALHGGVEMYPKRKRTIPLYGEGDDKGKWYKCWNCGFPCNIDRDSLDTGDKGRSGVNIVSKTMNGKTVYYPSISGGCKFCGSKNYK